MRTSTFAATVGIVLALVAVACGEADPYGDLGDQDTPTKEATGAATCSAAIEGKDPSTLTACTGTKGSKGRCVPKSVLGSFSDTFEKADCKAEEACLPEDLVKQGSKVELKKCNAVLNSEGRCFSPLAAQVLENYDLLKSATKDQCEGDQVCAPCADPRTNVATGVCTLGADSGGDCKGDKKPATAPAKAAACPQVEPILEASAFTQEDCSSNMLCVDPGLVGADRAKLLSKCKKGVCAPTKSVLRGGNYVPKTCKSLAGAEGRCSNVGVPDVAAQKSLLPVADCDADERCAPCFDPTTGKETGACSQATCDKPKEPAKTFASCCGGGGKCVPTASVSADSASSLNADSCSGDTPLCAPNAFLPGSTSGKKCSAVLGFIKGVCAPSCAINKNGLIKKIIESDDCGDTDVCVPCDSAPPGTAACK